MPTLFQPLCNPWLDLILPRTSNMKAPQRKKSHLYCISGVENNGWHILDPEYMFWMNEKKLPFYRWRTWRLMRLHKWYISKSKGHWVNVGARIWTWVDWPQSLCFNYDTRRLLWVLCDRDSEFSFSILLSSQLHLATSIL